MPPGVAADRQLVRLDPQATQFDLSIQGPPAQGAAQVLFRGLQATAGTRSVLGPGNWGHLPTSTLSLQVRSLVNNQLQQQFNLRPGGGVQ